MSKNVKNNTEEKSEKKGIIKKNQKPMVNLNTTLQLPLKKQ